MREPFLINGGIFSDERGVIRFVNDFTLEGIKRFYTITQSPESGPRAWQGHKMESKYFYCLKGSFALRLAKIDNWEEPGNSPEIKSFKLSDVNSDILVVPDGYANGIQALEEYSQLLIFSEKTIDEAKDDEVRFDKDRWINWKKI